MHCHKTLITGLQTIKIQVQFPETGQIPQTIQKVTISLPEVQASQTTRKKNKS